MMRKGITGRGGCQTEGVVILAIVCFEIGGELWSGAGGERMRGVVFPRVDAVLN